MAEPTVRVEGLRELRRDLRRLQPELDKQLRKDIKAAADKVAAAARANAPRRTGRYADSIKSYVTGTTASVGSRLPQAGVLHWGGTIKPRGVSITFPARPVISDAVDRQADQLVEDIGDAVDTAARRAGWKL